jgi:uncharacterized caspase-like protein
MSRSEKLCFLALCACAALPATAGAQEAKGKKVALLVGVTEYDSDKFATLKYTENDVEELATVLKKSGFDAVVMTNTRGKKDKDATPTAANVRAQLKRLTEKCGKDDTILVAFAGHGGQRVVGDPDGRTNSKAYSYLFPRDATLLGISYLTGKSNTLLLVSDLIKSLGESKAGTKLLLIDAGRSQIGGGKGTEESPSAPAGMGVLFSCAPGQSSFETSKLGKNGHGVFFHYVIEGLKKEAKTRRGDVTWSSLIEYVTEAVSEKVPALIGSGAKQTPHAMSNFRGSPVLVAAAKKD